VTELESMGVAPTDRGIYRHLNNGGEPPPESMHGLPPVDQPEEREKLAAGWEKLAVDNEMLTKQKWGLAAEYGKLDAANRRIAELGGEESSSFVSAIVEPTYARSGEITA
jgi:hypothetical protein